MNYRGIRINTDSTFDEFEYTLQDLLNKKLGSYRYEKGQGEYSVLEIADINNKRYLFFGTILGGKYNRFDLNYVNATGDIIVIASEDSEPVDVDRDEINSYFKGVDLDDDILNDELAYLEDLGDEYEYDSWCVRSDDEGQDY